MNPMGISISHSAARRLAEAIRATERLDRGGINNGAPWDWPVQPGEKGWPIKVTGKTSGGLYTGNIQYYDSLGWHNWPDNCACIVVPNNGGTLTAGDVYNGLFINYISGSPYYSVDSGNYATGGSGSGTSSGLISGISGSGGGAITSPTVTSVVDVGCTPGGTGTRVTYQVVSLATGAILSMYYVDKGCCGCGTPIPSGMLSSSGGGGSSLLTSCCANAIPTNLHLTISGTGGGTYAVTGDMVGNWDTGLITLGGAGGTLTVRLYCFGGAWSFQNNTGSPMYTVTSISGPTSASCLPFSQTFTGTLSGMGAYNGTTRTFTYTT